MSDDEDIADKLLARLAERDAVHQPAPSQQAVQALQGTGRKKPNRQKLRKERKAAEIEELRNAAEQESLSQVDQGKVEDELMVKQLELLNMREKEMPPDGHCMFNAFADQLALRHAIKTTYAKLRGDASEYIRNHPQDFMPYLVRETDGEMFNENDLQVYLDKMQNQAVWGGQTEISALSKTYKCPVHVVQSDSPVVKIGEDEFKAARPLWLAYRRHRYGLGEHYNSLVDA